jgi:hypothetical protein
MRNPMDFTPKEWYKEMDEFAKYQRKLMFRVFVLDMALFALWSALFMIFVVTLISLIKSA